MWSNFIPHRYHFCVVIFSSSVSTNSHGPSHDLSSTVDKLVLMMEPSLAETEPKHLLVTKLKKHVEVFDFTLPCLGKSTILIHSIKSGDTSPLNSRPYKDSPL